MRETLEPQSFCAKGLKETFRQIYENRAKCTLLYVWLMRRRERKVWRTLKIAAVRRISGGSRLEYLLYGTRGVRRIDDFALFLLQSLRQWARSRKEVGILKNLHIFLVKFFL